MPTGYTAAILEGDGITFEQYALSCARAFGAPVMMRDDPMDAPIPDKFDASHYHDEALETAKAELGKLEAMSIRERLAYGDKQKAAELARLTENLHKQGSNKLRLERMAKAVTEWQPPTPDHAEMKSFMLQQIKDTIKFDGDTDYHDRRLAEISAMPPSKFYLDARDAAARTISYHTTGAEKERARAAERTKWVQDLKLSLADMSTAAR